MSFFLRTTAASILLMSQFFGLFVGTSFAAESLEETQEEQLKDVERVEKVVDIIYDIVDEKIPEGEMKDRLDEKKEEIDDLLAETVEEIQEGASPEEVKEVVEETKKKIYLKTYSGLTDHDSVEELVQVEGGALEQEQAQETALDAMKSEVSNEYTVMLQSRLGFDEVLKKLLSFDQNIELEEMFIEDGIGYFELMLDEESLLAKELLGEVKEGEIPDHVLGISVVKPEVYEIAAITVAGHKGENNGQLRGMQDYQSVAYQGGLQTKKKITVGVVDTGIDRNHPDLKDNMSTRIAGYDFVNKDNDPMDDHIHGTHVAGTIGGALNGKGVYGVNSNVDLVALKICNKYGYCPSYAIFNAVKYAADKGVDVLNLSLGGRGSTKNNTTCQAIDYAVKKGVIVVAAAGNANKPVARYIPGACPSAITVGAVDKNHKRASFSNYGPLVDISAPGVEIYSTTPGGKYTSLNGTSMATPHISGLVSSILAYKPNLTQSQMRALLKSSVSKVTYESGKVIGGFSQMPKIMSGLGVKQYSHAYKVSGSLSSESSSAVSISSIDEGGMQVNTQYVKLRVGQKKQVIVSDAKDKISVKLKPSDYIMAVGIGSFKGKHAQKMTIQSADGETTEVKESEILLGDEEGPELQLPSDEELAKLLETSGVKPQEGDIVESLIDDADTDQQIQDEEDGAMIASANKVGVIDVLGLIPGKTSFDIIDTDLKKIKIVVEVLPSEIVVTQGVPKYVGVQSRSRVWNRGNNTLPKKTEAYRIDQGRQGKYFKITPYQLGKHTITVPIYNLHAPKRNGRKKAGTAFVNMQFTLKVISPRKDDQAKLQEKDESFWMSHDYAKLKVGEKVTIKLEGNGPFTMKRKTGGIIGYAGKSGAGTKIASAGEADDTQEQFALDIPAAGLIEEDEAQKFMSDLLEVPAEELISEEEYEGEEMATILPDFTEGEEETTDPEEGVEIASAGGGTSVTLVGLMPGNEVLYVTDKHGKTKNVILQVQETRLLVSECVRSRRGRYDRNCGRVSIYTDPTRNAIRSMSFPNGNDYRSYYGRVNNTRGYEIPGMRNNRSYAYKYFKNISLTRNTRSASTSPAVLNVYVENQIEDPVYSRWSRRGKKVLQTMQYTIDYGKAKPAKAVTPLSKLGTDITEVPDAFKLAGTMRMTVGDMKTVMVGSQGGRYSYRKANNNIGFIANKKQDVKIASSGDGENEVDALIETPATEEILEGEAVEDIEIPEEIDETESLTENQLTEIDSIESHEDSDLEYAVLEEQEDEVAIASVKGVPVTFVALRPGVSYITVKYATGKWERVKVVISPKVVKKKSTETLRLVSTNNLVIRSIWTKKRASLKFIKKPVKRWKGGVWEIQAGSMHQNDKLYAQVYNRKERKYMYLELHPSVVFPPIKTSRNSMTITAGQTATLGISGGGGSYSVVKNSHRIGFMANTKNAVKIASAESSAEELNEESEEVQMKVDIEEEELDPIKIDESQESLPTEDQLKEGPEENTEEESSDFSTDEEVQEQEGEGVEIASTWKKKISFQGLRPVKATITITDTKGLSKKIIVSVKKKVIRKDDGEILKLTSAYGLPIRYARTKSGTPLKFKKIPSSRRRGGVWHIDTSNFKTTETIYARIYNRQERVYQWLEFDVQIKPAPAITTNKDTIYLRVGQTYNLKMAGGARKISVKKDNQKIGFMNSVKQGVAIASAGEQSDQEDTELELDLSEAVTDPELESLVEDDVLPSEKELNEPEDELHEESKELDDDRGEVDEEITEAITDEETEGVEIASAKKRRKEIPLQALRPGTTYVTISDEKGQVKKVKVRIYTTAKTKNRGDDLIFKSSYAAPIKYLKTKSGTPIKIASKPAKRWKGGTWKIDTSNLKSTEIVYGRVYNRKEKRYQWIEIKLYVKDIPMKLSATSLTTNTGAAREFTIEGGLAPYTFEYDKTKVQVLKVKPGETNHQGKYYVYSLLGGDTSITIKDSYNQAKTLAVSSNTTETQVTPGEELRFSNKEGYALSDIVGKSGTRLPIRKTATTWFLDTTDLEKTETFYVYYYAKADKKSLKYEYKLSVRALPTGPAGYIKCANEGGTCIPSTPVTVAFGTNGKYKYKDYDKGQKFRCTTNNFGDPIKNTEKACWVKERVVKVEEELVEEKEIVEEEQNDINNEKNLPEELKVNISSNVKESGPIVTVKVTGGKAPYEISVPDGLIYIGNSLGGSTSIQSSGGDETRLSTVIQGNDIEEVSSSGGVSIANIGVIERNLTQKQAESIEYYFAHTTTEIPTISVRDANSSTVDQKVQIFETKERYFQIKKGHTIRWGGNEISPGLTFSNISSGSDEIALTCNFTDPDLSGPQFNVTGIAVGVTKIYFSVMVSRNGNIKLYDVWIDVEIIDDPNVIRDVECGDDYTIELVKEKAYTWAKDNESKVLSCKEGDSFVVGLVEGDYAEDGGLCTLAGHIIGGEIPIAGWGADLRDLNYAIAHCEGIGGCAVRVGINGLAFIPILGSLKYVDDFGAAVNKGVEPIIKNGFVEVNGLKFSEYYYEKLRSTGRGAPSLIAREVFEGAIKSGKIKPDPKGKDGFFEYIHAGIELIFNPKTKEVRHLQPL